MSFPVSKGGHTATDSIKFSPNLIQECSDLGDGVPCSQGDDHSMPLHFLSDPHLRFVQSERKNNNGLLRYLECCITD